VLLPFHCHSDTYPSSGVTTAATIKKIMSQPVIAKKSPFVLPMQPGTYHFCTCGQSKGQPFCDGSHKGSGFAPKAVTLTEAKTVAWCGCKHSANGAFCDGTHAKL
jgi:CDGSH iron-sulfur domain-containing protein 3